MANNVRKIFIGDFSGTSPVTTKTGNFDLRVSPFAVAGIVGAYSAGSWLFVGLNDTAEYKLYNTDTGTEVDFVGGGTNTRAFYDTALQGYVDLTTGQSVGGSKTLSGTTTLSGNSFMYNPFVHTSGAPWIAGVPPSGNSIVWKDYVLSLFAESANRALIAEANLILVDGNRSADIANYIYNDLQGALTYASSVASGSSRYSFLIVPHKNNASLTGYVENLTLYKFCDLIGLGDVLITGSLTYSGVWTGGTYAKWQNIVHNSADDVSKTIRGIEGKHCKFRVAADSLTPSITLQNSQLEHCGFYAIGQPDASIVSGDTNTIIDCYGNDTIAWASGDKIMGYDYYDDGTLDYQMT